MKKLLFVLAIGAFAACGSGESTSTSGDTTSTSADTTTVAPAPDTTHVDTTAHVDTTKVDSTKK